MNRFEDICRLLDSIGKQGLPKMEVVVVVDHCPELTSSLLQVAAKKPYGDFDLRVISNTGPLGVNTCRNIAIAACTGDIVGVVDDDVTLTEGWASRAVKAFTQRSDVVAITGPVIPSWDDPESMAWFPKELYFALGCTVWDWEGERIIRNVGGMNAVFRKESLVQSGMYDVQIGPKGGGIRSGKFSYVGAEEVELCIRMRNITHGKVLYLSDLLALHRVRKNDVRLGYLVRRSFHLGYSKAYVAKKFPNNPEQVDMMQLEKEHLLRIVEHFPVQVIRESDFRPEYAFKRVLFVFVGALSAALGYLLFSESDQT